MTIHMLYGKHDHTCYMVNTKYDIHMLYIANMTYMCYMVNMTIHMLYDKYDIHMLYSKYDIHKLYGKHDHTYVIW